MIDDGVFATWWTRWTEQFLTGRGRPPHGDDHTVGFRHVMEENLTTEEFEAVAETIYRHAKWFPTISEVLETAELEIRQRGLADWQRIREIVAETPLVEREHRGRGVYRSLSRRAQRALDGMMPNGERSILEALAEADTEDPRVEGVFLAARHAFLEAYRRLIREELAPPRRLAGELPRLPVPLALPSGG